MTDTPVAPADLELTPTQKSVLEQLTENTGRHMLDSGDHYGRHWSSNQRVGAANLAATPETTISWKFGLDITHHLAQWLPERVDYLPELDEVFVTWAQAEAGEVETYRYGGAEIVKRADAPWLQSASEFAALIGGKGIYGEGDPVVVNTYNGEDLLSQVLQFVYFTLDSEVRLISTPLPDGSGVDLTLASDREVPTCAYCERPLQHVDNTLADDTGTEACEGTGSGGQHEEADDPQFALVEGESVVEFPAGEFALLQVHGGADVRGGYTRPRLYHAWLEDGPSLFDNARATIGCSNNACRDRWDQPTRWETDNAYTYSSESGADLGTYDHVEVDFEDTEDENYALASDAGERIGKLVIDTDADVAYCPVCGVGTLQAYAY